ncbi:60S ribosomal protein L8B [Actinomortierella ambigua]|uniref:60S ribosomal protein L8 n=1 Tax=Actinomortierella ambigua TaxID=1343610 RepID=A0A9P6U076_9FUNG|nr:60S ribosomal protein L8B [Actinomortierella ambigua]KAG0253585.1 60S ribosomal protein L8B [Actinomortierella ambigua]
MLFLEAPKKTVTKKPASSPFGAKKAVAKTPVNPLIEKTPKNFGIGSDLQPARDLSRYIKWPEYVRLQRQKRILSQRLKVPPTLNQFNQPLDKNTATQIFKLAAKYRPETKAEKKKRLTEQAAKKAEGKPLDATKKPKVLKYGLNHVTALIEAKKAQLVVIARDVDPIELVLWMPALCKKMGVPYVLVNGRARLGALIHKRTATAVVFTEIHDADKKELADVISAIKTNFSEKTKDHTKWSTGVLGHKSQIKLAKRVKAAQASILPK